MRFTVYTGITQKVTRHFKKNYFSYFGLLKAVNRINK